MRTKSEWGMLLQSDIRIKTYLQHATHKCFLWHNASIPPATFGAKSLVWYTGPLTPGFLTSSPLAFPHPANPVARWRVHSYTHHVPCPLAFLRVAPLLGGPVFSLPPNIRLAIFTHHSSHSSSSLSHSAEYTLPFCTSLRWLIHYFSINYGFLEGSASLKLQQGQSAWYIAGHQ